ncbi:sterol desaturase family protein [Paraflavisolibacter sp. H34]|uniref:sterol desaturase family protein n=1 Tax=Huijunlia imazamoxiresistens TaxID=3127457 RepID=UPI003015A6ED
MKHLNLMAFAIPFFLFFIGWEYVYSLQKNKKLFSFAESIANLNVGIGERLSDLFTTGFFYFFFSYIHEHYALFDIRPGVVTWVLLFLCTDLVWYWYHRAAHEINLFWAVHIVHHQSEDFNYTVSVRITLMQAVARSLFWSVLPLVGFPPEMIAILLLVHGAYPFFTHTQAVGRLGWLEYVLVTPSHHRVHHASNELYLDKNYGDMLIIWDKLFGTFQPETEPPVYGLTQPLKSYSFLWQHFHNFLELAVAVQRTRGLGAKLELLFSKPETIDPRIRPLLERRLLHRENVRPTKALNQYVAVQTVLTLVALFLLVLLEYYLTSVQLVLAAAFILVSMITTAAMLEQRRWIFYLELARVALLLAFINQYALSPNFGLACAALFGLLLLFNRTLGHRYCNLFYTVPR